MKYFNVEGEISSFDLPLDRDGEYLLRLTDFASAARLILRASTDNANERKTTTRTAKSERNEAAISINDNALLVYERKT